MLSGPCWTFGGNIVPLRPPPIWPEIPPAAPEVKENGLNVKPCPWAAITVPSVMASCRPSSTTSTTPWIPAAVSWTDSGLPEFLTMSEVMFLATVVIDLLPRSRMLFEKAWLTDR